MSDVTASSDDGEDYIYGGGQLQEIKRYPVHDCCEFEDAESLRVSGNVVSNLLLCCGPSAGLDLSGLL